MITLTVSNIVAAFLASKLIGSGLALIEASLLASAIGVSSFQGVLTNTNITIFNRGVLTIQDWIDKSRTSAIGVAVSKEGASDMAELIATAEGLRNIDELRLNTYLTQHSISVAETEAEARASRSDVRLFKALKLVNKNRVVAKAVLDDTQNNNRA